MMKHLFIALATFCLLCIFTVLHSQDSTLISFDDVTFEESKPDKKTTEEDTAEIIKNATDSESPANFIAPSTSKEEKRTLWNVFLAGLIGGFAAFVMPCIFPMVPLTVSFFTKKSSTRPRAMGQALIYGLFIILIYVSLGMLITIAFGSDALNALSTNGLFNFLFFIVLILFAASFFGAFEITLPNSFINKIDTKSEKGGLAGLFFMAFSLALVSFSCTGPIIGTLLVEAASKGERLAPAVGMLGFSIALAIPFVLFAIFPSIMKSLPKSGGWLNSVKIVLGFLELALAMKFLSNVDLAYHWNWLDREIFLAIWITIFALMGLYLLGMIKFAHDSTLQFISFPRIAISILTFSFVLYMLPGMWGAPLKSISAFLPPSATQDFYLSNSPSNNSTTNNKETSKTSKKYYNIFHERGTPRGFDPYYDYNEGIEASKKSNKPLLIDFTGWNCVNCRKMENSVWIDQDVADILKTKYVMVELFVDDRTELDPEEQYVSTFSGKRINTIGKKNSDFQASKYNSNSQPLYVITDSDGKVLIQPKGADYEIESYKRFLLEGVEKYHTQMKSDTTITSQ